MPFGLLHWRGTILVTVTAQCALALGARATRTENALPSRFREIIVEKRRWAGGNVQVFQVQLRRLVLNPLVIDNQVIGNGQLIMRIATQ